MPDPDATDVTAATREAEHRDEAIRHGSADRGPTPEEERLADQQELDPEVAKAYAEQAQRGADVKGEGRV
jgi:hypothetical protein